MENKIDAHKEAGKKNYGVWGRKLLPEVLKEAQTKYEHWSDEKLHSHKMNHGHNLMTKY